ncbi:MAG: outer membrane beta-barrel protein [Bacteroidetes bacterium]|nr:outer membrane beta-barrel protein [Bacteroidota bacterium]
MKKIKLILFATALCVAIGSTASAQQGRTMININYSVNSPSGSFKSDVISKTSLRGWNLSVLYGLSNNFSIGAQAGFNDFSEKFPRAVYNTKSGAISAVLSNSVQTIPIQVKAKYNFFPVAPVQPYVAAGIGGNIATYNQFLGEFSNSGTTKFGFAATPEAGIIIPFGKNSASGITIGAIYNYMPYSYQGVKNLNNWGVFAGIKFPLK